jgi:hypothetical protein
MEPLELNFALGLEGQTLRMAGRIFDMFQEEGIAVRESYLLITGCYTNRWNSLKL